MNPRGIFALILVVILLITQFPTMFCVISHSPDGDIEDTTTTETVNKIESLLRCVTPTSAFGMFLFVVGGVVATLMEQ